MHVIRRMARHAHARRSFVSISEVAFGALHGLVLVVQRKGRLAVIEPDLLPGFRVMTGGAVLSQLALVRFLRLVARHAFARGLAEFLAVLVTTVAGNDRVRIPQRKVSGFVTEGLPVEFHDVSITPLMLHVTGAALSGFDAGQMAVEAVPGPNVRCDLLVAVQAQLPLTAPIAAVMTGRALLLVFLMSNCQLAGHEELLRVHGATVAHRKKAQQNLHYENPRPESGSH
jgi:hypothetical protein